MPSVSPRRSPHRDHLAVDWAPPDDYLLAAADRLFVLATRAGLGRVLARSRPVPRGGPRLMSGPSDTSDLSTGRDLSGPSGSS